jgi:L-aspartate oxidase
MPDSYQAIPLDNPPVAPATEHLDLQDVRNALKSLVWRAAGVRRNGDSLRDAAKSIEQWQRYALAQQFSDPAGWELQNMLTVARVMIGAALRREESRGVHLRSDFPEQDDVHWKVRLGDRRVV